MKFLIGTVGFGDDNLHDIFAKELEKLKSNWDDSKYKHVFIPVSVSYAVGGTHIIISYDSETIKIIENELKNLLAEERWTEYKLTIKF